MWLLECTHVQHVLGALQMHWMMMMMMQAPWKDYADTQSYRSNRMRSVVQLCFERGAWDQTNCRRTCQRLHLCTTRRTRAASWHWRTWQPARTATSPTLDAICSRTARDSGRAACSTPTGLPSTAVSAHTPTFMWVSEFCLSVSPLSVFEKKTLLCSSSLNFFSQCEKTWKQKR